MTQVQKFFDAHQRATIEAAMARIIPADDQAGAREAGTVEFVDRYLSGIDFFCAKPDGSGFEKLEGRRAQAWQQRIEIIRAKYVEGIKELDRKNQSRFAADFVRLSPEQQDGILEKMERLISCQPDRGAVGHRRFERLQGVRVELDDKVRDAWGLARCTHHEQDSRKRPEDRPLGDQQLIARGVIITLAVIVARSRK
jgi:Gluconate 2-dehydrogenase subunit 3